MIITRVAFAVLASATFAIDAQPAGAEIFRPGACSTAAAMVTTAPPAPYLVRAMHDDSARRRVLRPESVVLGLWRRPERPGERRTKQPGQAALIALRSKPLPAVDF
jgi:hypothetical protein